MTENGNSPMTPATKAMMEALRGAIARPVLVDEEGVRSCKPSDVCAEVIISLHHAEAALALAEAEMKKGETAPTIPSGWQLVPREPTEEMIDGALATTAAWRDLPGSGLTVNRRKATMRYKAMLSAAPSPSEKPASPIIGDPAEPPDVTK